MIDYVADRKFQLFLKTLIDNAILYNKKDGEIEINIKYNDGLNIEIIDTGIGIPMDETSKIGKEMFRGVKVKANTNGTGLSLLLVKKVLDLTGGKMSFKTEEGKGSGFEINLK